MPSPRVTTPNPAPAPAAKGAWLRWQLLLSSSVLLLALVALVSADLSHLNRVARLSGEGSPAPERDAQSFTGYSLGQRYFLAPHERGETYRWIARTQELLASGLFAASPYQADNVPEGRAQLAPRLYALWLVGLSWGIHFTTDEPLAISAERAALWEPVVSHVLLFAAVVAFMGIRHGAAGACLAGIFIVLFPPVSGQFLPGVLTPRTWALCLAALAIALQFPGKRSPGGGPSLGAGSALAAGLALWLDPMFGFSAVLVPAAAAISTIMAGKDKLPCFRWSFLGAGVTFAAWLIDRSPWDPAAGELRYVHPFYGFAWLGLGLGLDACQNLRRGDSRRHWRVLQLVVALALLAPLVHSQLHERYAGWLYPSAALRRLTSLDETAVYLTALDWISAVSFGKAFFVFAPALFAVLTLVIPLGPKAVRKHLPSGFRVHAAVLVAGVLVLTFFKVRWGVVAALVSLPVMADFIAQTTGVYRRWLLAISAVFLAGLFAWDQARPAALRASEEPTVTQSSDLEALVSRHFAYWLATHNPGRKVTALAPPELSDSLVFHGGCRVLMSTAWEAYSGQVAASRILSAPEASEAEAVLQSREITHVILPSWDPVLPLLVRNPDLEGKDTLYARLQRWVHPRFLRAMPYRLPPVPGYAGQKLAVFKVTAPQDEALSLSRLAEYFVEMDRAEPASLAAKVLAETFADDPSASIARASVHAATNNRAAFEAELPRLAAGVSQDQSFLPWDQRVQRAILLALARRSDLARPEIEACIAAASPDELFELTPLQAFRLRSLMNGYQLSFRDRGFDALLGALGAEYAPASPPARR